MHPGIVLGASIELIATCGNLPGVQKYYINGRVYLWVHIR